MLFDPDDLRTLRPWLIEHVCRFWLARIHDPAGGFFETIDALGAPVANQRRSTLVQARLTYVFSHAYLVTGDASAIQLADATWEFMQHRLAHPRCGGFFEEFVPGRTEVKLPRRQNPHMHLLEALLALHVATGEKNWLRRAGALVDLFKRRFSDPETGALIEF